MRKLLPMVLGAALFSTLGGAQTATVPLKLVTYPQMILYNGKIVTMDDTSFEARVGTIVQAMAIRDDKILATGSSAEIRALAGPTTKAIDLKGRTVLPSFIMTHEHPTDWVWIQPRSFRHVLPNDAVIVSRWLPNLPPKEQLAMFEGVMKEAVAKAKPGQWIRVIFNFGPTREWNDEFGGLMGSSINKAWLDVLAPNNPVAVKTGLGGAVGNTKAIQEFLTVHAAVNNDAITRGRADPLDAEQTAGAYKSGSMGRPLHPDVVLKGKLPLLAQLLKAEFELWASWGMTTFGSSPYAFSNLQAIDLLDKKGEMPSRFAWGYTGPAWDLETLRVLAGTLGHGTDRLWLIGAWGQNGSGCLTVPSRPDFQVPPNEDCRHFASGAWGRPILERIIESGLRVATMHTGGDQDIDLFMDVIEQISQKAGIPLDEIRAKRHAFDHGGGAPRPEQIARLKNLGMIVSENNTLIWEPGSSASDIAARYGLEYTDWVVPRKRLAESGVMSGFEIDRPIPDKIFYTIGKGMTRYHDKDQRAYGPGQGTDRIIQLKALTRWGSYYVLRENLLGTLEPSKFADFIVLDRDFLTIPEAEIPQTRVLMTVVGGKTVHLTSELAREVGMPPAGATTWTEPVPEGW